EIGRVRWKPPHTPTRLLQGSLAEAMTYVGQLELLRQLTVSSDPLRLTTERIIEAPVQRIWEAWTDPDKIARWWGPEGFKSDVNELYVSYGGRFVVAMRGPDGTVY